jgi:predicted permease
MEETFAHRWNDARALGFWTSVRICRRELAGLIGLLLSERCGASARLRWQRQRTQSREKAGRMDAVGREIRYAARRLVRSPAFTLAAVLTLALAIGANAAIFTVVYRVVLNPLPYQDSGRLIALDFGLPARNINSGVKYTSWQLYYQLADRARTLERVAVYNFSDVTLRGTEGKPERILTSRATPSLASVLRVQPALGRWFTEQEGIPGSPPPVVLSHGLWIRRYGRDPAIVGRSLTIDGLPTTVVGVMPASFTFPDARTDAWIAAQSTRATASSLLTLMGVARLRDGATLASARAEITQLMTDLSRVSPNHRGWISTAMPLQDAIVGQIAHTLWILLASVGLVLLVACANVANLFLVRSDARRREVAVRQALGAGSRALAGYFLAESLLLSIAGSVIGLGLSWGAVRLLVAFAPVNLPRLEEVRLDAPVLAFTLALSMLTALAFGAIPWLRLAALPASLHESGRSNTASRGRYRARQLLMGGQVALALVLVVFSGLMLRSFQKLRAVDPGFDARSALTFSIALPEREYASRRSAVATHLAILDRLSAIPGVTAASASTCLPLSTYCLARMVVPEGVVDDGTLRLGALFYAVAGGYFEATGIRLLRGRFIDRGDVERGEPVAVVNTALADALFPHQDPLGKRFRSSGEPPSSANAPPWLEIVGVVSNTPVFSLAERTPVAQLYMPMSIAGGPDIPAATMLRPNVSKMSYALRAATTPANLGAAVRTALSEIDPNLALFDVRSLEHILDRAAAQMAFTMTLIVIAASVALLLGVIGIYGVMSYIVSQRTGEIGVRLALGADPGQVAGMIIRQGGLVAIAGVIVGLGLAYAGSRLIASLLYGVSARDPVVFAATTVLLSTVALVACWLPARRGARLSPLEALRTE